MPTFTARWIVPIVSEPLSRGWIRVNNDGVIEALGSGATDGPVIDLGDTAILPALVNCHTHLEFSDQQRPIGEPGMPMPRWLRLVIQSRGERDPQSVQKAMLRGIEQSVAHGVGVIADIATPPDVHQTPHPMVEVISFAEVLGLSENRFNERVKAAVESDAVGLSPHSPYSLRRESITDVIGLAVQRQQPLAMHVAETPAERDLCFRGSGELADMLRSFDSWEPSVTRWADASDWQPLIELLAGASRALIVHGNDFNNAELRCIAQYSNLTVVFCPRTHHFFDRTRHPVGEAMAMGIRVAIGTDSLASNPDLSVWSEVQHLLRHRQDLDPHLVLRMATLHGAEALGLPKRGRLSVDAQPGLIQVPTTASSRSRLMEDFAAGDQPKFIGI